MTSLSRAFRVGTGSHWYCLLLKYLTLLTSPQYSRINATECYPVSGQLKNNCNFCDALIYFWQTKYSETKPSIPDLKSASFDGLLARETLAEGAVLFRWLTFSFSLRYENVIFSKELLDIWNDNTLKGQVIRTMINSTWNSIFITKWRSETLIDGRLIPTKFAKLWDVETKTFC